MEFVFDGITNWVEKPELFGEISLKMYQVKHNIRFILDTLKEQYPNTPEIIEAHNKGEVEPYLERIVVDLSNASDTYAFFTSNKLVNVRDINVYNCSNLVNMFCDSRALINVDNIICVNDANCLNMFYNCSKLVSISNLKLSSITNAYQMFSRCNNLVNLPMLNLHNVNNMTSTFYACNNLSSNSYANIANSLPLANNLTNKYLSSMSLNVNNFTVEQILILNNKGYIDANLSAYSNEYEITYSNL